MINGYFIVLEGVDGSGTTTQSQNLANYLFRKYKMPVVLTKEPTVISDAGKELRRRLSEKLLDSEEVINDPRYWAKLFVEDRSWHLERVVLPAIRNGINVVSDRHMLSTLAYQSAQGMNIDELISMHNGLHPPDLTIFLHLNAKIAMQRINSRNDGGEYFERVSFLESVGTKYEEAIQRFGPQQNIVVIDGSFGKDEVKKIIEKETDKLYGGNS